VPPSTSGNAIINGAFDIWQRGTSLSAGGFLADRWFFDSDASVLSQSRQTFTPGSAPVAGYEGAYYLNFTKNGSGSYGGVYQKIEDVRTFAGQSATLSFWAKANNATTMTSRVSQEFGSGGSSTVNLTDQTVSLTTSWQRFTLTYSFGVLTGKTIGTSSFVKWLFFAAGSGAANVDLWGVQFESGTTATAFKRNASNIQGELAACQRYYQQAGAWSGFGENTTAIAATIPFQVRPRISTPTISIIPGGVLSWRSQFAVDVSTTSFSLVAATPDFTGLWVLFSGLTGIQDNLYHSQRYSSATLSNIIAVDAEL
jgi:hypothetical protein